MTSSKSTSGPEGLTDSPSSRPEGTLRLMTWNIWFRELELPQRMHGIVSHVRILRPDIVGFQEVTQDLRTYLEAKGSVLREVYQRLETNVEAIQSYWESLYTTLPIGPRSMREAYEDSGMGRGVTILHCPKLDLVVGTTHLESMFFAGRREEQAAHAFALLDSFGTRNAVLMGDTNLHEDQNIDHIMPEGWVDAWDMLRPQDPGFTYDAERNGMISDHYRERLDRIFIRTKDYLLKDIGILGESPIGLWGDQLDLFASDHFGLLLDLKRKPDAPAIVE